MPSSAILITPPRSENIPPSEASVSGVAYLTIEARSERLMIVLSIWFGFFASYRNSASLRETRLTNLLFRAKPQSPAKTLNSSSNESLRAASKDCLTSDKQNNDRLQNHNPILRNVVSEDVYEQP